MATTSSISTSMFLFLEKTERMGCAISAGESTASATWYSKGWNVWWLRRSIRVTSTAISASVLAALKPAKPPPTTTTRGRLRTSAMQRPSLRRQGHQLLDVLTLGFRPEMKSYAQLDLGVSVMKFTVRTLFAVLD